MTMESEGSSYGVHQKSAPVGLAQYQKPSCNQHLHHMCQCEFMKFLNIIIDGAELKLCFDFLER